MTLEEVSQAIRYHALLNTTSDLQVSTVGEFVWYAVKQQPRLCSSGTYGTKTASD